MESISQAQDRLESRIIAKNGFYRGVLWATCYTSADESLPEKESQKYSFVVLARCIGLQSPVTVYYSYFDKVWYLYPSLGQEIVVIEWRYINFK